MLFLFRTIPAIVYSSHMVFPLYLASFKIHLRDQTPWQLLHTCNSALIDNIEIIYMPAFLEKKNVPREEGSCQIHYYAQSM